MDITELEPDSAYLVQVSTLTPEHAVKLIDIDIALTERGYRSSLEEPHWLRQIKAYCSRHRLNYAAAVALLLRDDYD